MELIVRLCGNFLYEAFKPQLFSLEGLLAFIPCKEFHIGSTGLVLEKTSLKKTGTDDALLKILAFCGSISDENTECGCDE